MLAKHFTVVALNCYYLFELLLYASKIMIIGYTSELIIIG